MEAEKTSIGQAVVDSVPTNEDGGRVCPDPDDWVKLIDAEVSARILPWVGSYRATLRSAREFVAAGSTDQAVGMLDALKRLCDTLERTVTNG